MTSLALCPSVHRSEAWGRCRAGSSVAELMPRASHFIPARMNGLIVGNRVVAARGLHGIMAALASCHPDLCVPRKAARRAGQEEALCRGRKGTPKPQVLTLEPCGMEPACLYHCCISALPAAQTPLNLLAQNQAKKIYVWTSGLVSTVRQGASTSHPTCLTAGWGHLGHVSWWPHSPAVR